MVSTSEMQVAFAPHHLGDVPSGHLIIEPDLGANLGRALFV